MCNTPSAHGEDAIEIRTPAHSLSARRSRNFFEVSYSSLSLSLHLLYSALSIPNTPSAHREDAIEIRTPAHRLSAGPGSGLTIPTALNGPVGID